MVIEFSSQPIDLASIL